MRKRGGWEQAEEPHCLCWDPHGAACAAAVVSPLCFPGEVMGLPILLDVLVGESCAGPHGWCRTQLPRLSAACEAAVEPSLVVHKLVQEGRADSPQGETGCRDGAQKKLQERKRSSLGRGQR